MITEINLSPQESKDTRSGFGKALTELGQQHQDVFALCADLTGSLKMNDFKNQFPERFVQTGIAEANMIGIAAGLATAGKVPFAGTFANFATGRVYDQIRQSIAYSEKNVKICASHAGLTLGEDGATHQILEDIGLMKMLPNMVVINPCDFNQTYLATKAIYEHNGPVYLRFGRPKWPVFTSIKDNFIIGKAQTYREGNDISLLATGHMVWYAVQAALELEKEGINAEVINIHTIKPLDEGSILESAQKTKKVIVCEEHQKAGGLGESVAALLSSKLPTYLEQIAVNDSFGESGKPNELLEKYGLGITHIVSKAQKMLNA